MASLDRGLSRALSFSVLFDDPVDGLMLDDDWMPTATVVPLVPGAKARRAAVASPQLPCSCRRSIPPCPAAIRRIYIRYTCFANAVCHRCRRLAKNSSSHRAMMPTFRRSSAPSLPPRRSPSTAQ